MRFALKAALWAVLGVALLLGGALLLLDSAPGRRLAEDAVNRMLPGVARVEGLEEGLLGEVRLRRLELRDPAGVWLSASDVRLDWRPGALLRGVLSIESLDVGQAELFRPPEVEENAQGEGGGPPFRIAVDRFAVGTLRLADGVPAGPAAVSLSGGFRFSAKDRIEASLELRRLDAPGDASASFHVADGTYETALSLKEPSGGLLARLLRLEDAPPIVLALDGRGPLDSFDLTFEGAAGEARTTGRAELRRIADGVGFSAEASGAVAAFLPPELKPLAAEGLTLAAAGFASPQGAGRLERFELRSGSTALVASGAVEVGGKLSGRIEASGPLAPLVAIARAQGSGDWTLSADLDGSLAEPSARWRLALSEPRLDELGAVALEAEGEAGYADAAVRFEARASAQRPSFPQAPLPETISASVAGTFDPATGDLVARRIALDGAPYALEGQGALDGSGEASIEFAARASSLAAFGLRGAAAVDGAASGRIGALRGSLAMRLSGLSLGQPALDAALGPAPSATFLLRQDGDAVRIDRASARGARATLAGSGAIGADRLSAALTLTLPDLAALGAPAPGSARIEASIEGTPAAFAGPVSLAADLGSARLTAQGRAGVDEKSLELTGLKVDGTGLSGGGELSIPRAGGAPKGRLELRVADLRPWAGIAEVPASGVLQIEARLAGGGLRAEASASRLSFGEGARIGAASLEARLDDLLAPRGAVVATVQSAALAGREVSQVRLEADLAGHAASFRLRGEAADDALSASGDASWRDGERLTLKRLDGRVAGQLIRLTRAATFSRRGSAVAIEGFDLAFGDGRLRADAKLDARTVEGRLAAAGLPLAPFLGEAAGRLEGELRLTGAVADPRATLRARVTAGRAGLPPELAKVALRLQGDWREDRVALTAELTDAPGTTAKARPALPLHGNFADWSFALPPEGRVDGGLDAEVDIAALAPFLPLDGHRFAGRLTAALRAEGSVARPVAAGEARLSGGRYDGDAFGTALRDVGLLLRGDGSRIVLEQLSASDGAAGRLAGAGELRLDEKRVDGRLSLTRFRLANSDELQAIASASFALAGPFDAAALSGEIEVHEAEYAIPRKLPTRIAELDVVEVNLPPGRKPLRPPADDAQEAPAFDPALNLAVRAPGQVFVRGRGLDSEWAGDLRIGGRLSDPAVTGELRVVRGQFALAGKSLKLTAGSVTFPDRGPGAEEPELDVAASTRAGEATAELKVAGPVSAIEISLSSQPPLPQDEILSRLLFGTGAASLGPAQALQLAQTAWELSGRGGSGGVLADIRKRFGLDFLDVETAEGGEGLDAARLRAGKYVREDVYVGVRQGAKPGSTSAVVEYEFLPNLSLEGSVGADSQAGVGLNWERRY